MAGIAHAELIPDFSLGSDEPVDCIALLSRLGKLTECVAAKHTVPIFYSGAGGEINDFRLGTNIESHAFDLESSPSP